MGGRGQSAILLKQLCLRSSTMNSLRQNRSRFQPCLVKFTAIRYGELLPRDHSGADSSKLDVLCAADQKNAIQQAVANCGALQYAKVNMKLIDLLSGDFFSQYVKTGTYRFNPSMLRASDEI